MSGRVAVLRRTMALVGEVAWASYRHIERKAFLVVVHH
jgi:hypothetical protein